MRADAHFQVYPEIFDWVQVQAVAGPLKDIHRVVCKPLLRCLGSLSCWKVFTEERIEFGHTAIKPRTVECCSDVCPYVDFSCLHIWSWSSTRVTIRFFVTTLTKTLLHQLLSLASSRKNLGCFKLLLLRVTETMCICDPLWTLLQICGMTQTCFCAL